MSVMELIVRITTAFIVLFVLSRIMGRKEISQMTFFNFVSAIAIGSIAANLALSPNISIRNGVIALIGWTIFTLAMDIIDIKFKKARVITTGQPVTVIKEGKIMESALRKVRLDMDTLNTLLRKNNVFSITDVDYAVFETSGNLSVMKKESKQPVTKGDMSGYSPTKKMTPMATEVVADGKVLSENLTKLHLNENWLNQQLKENGIEKVEDVFYAEVQPDGSLYIDNKNDIH